MSKKIRKQTKVSPQNRVSLLLAYYFKIISTNKLIAFLVLVYCIVGLIELPWGLPNSSHPFAYNMDEWAQAHSLMSTFKQGSPHVHGGGNGTFFFYIQSGVMLAPFVLLRIVNPFVIKTSLDAFDVQLKLFEILRLQSILYAILSIILISFLAQRYFKSNKYIAAFFFTINPVFLLLAHYYRYDTAVVFWILLSLLFSLRYITFPTTKNFLLSVVIASLAVTIKVSAIPLLFTCLAPFFFVTPQWGKKLYVFLAGIITFVIVFVVAGIPDALVSSTKFIRWFYLSLGVEGNNNTDLGIPYWLYHIFVTYPASFGHVAYLLFVGSLLLWIILYKKTQPQKIVEKKYELFLFFSFFIFAASLIPLEINAHGNRLMVMLPFLGLISSVIMTKVPTLFNTNKRTLLNIILICGITIQIAESFAWVSTKIFPDPRTVSAQWVKSHIPRGSTIGLENVPIFQYIPDNVLKDFYTKEYNPKAKTIYSYQLINGQTKKFPHYVILTDEKIAQKFFKKSDKKLILKKLREQRYKPIITFTANYSYYHFFNDEQVFYFSALPYTPSTITIYKN